MDTIKWRERKKRWSVKLRLLFSPFTDECVWRRGNKWDKQEWSESEAWVKRQGTVFHWYCWKALRRGRTGERGRGGRANKVMQSRMHRFTCCFVSLNGKREWESLLIKINHNMQTTESESVKRCESVYSRTGRVPVAMFIQSTTIDKVFRFSVTICHSSIRITPLDASGCLHVYSTRLLVSWIIKRIVHFLLSLNECNTC